MTIKRKTTITDKGTSEVSVKTEITQDNLRLMAFNKLMRQMPAKQRQFFKKHCKIVGFYPIYAPQGMFKAHETVLTLDQDQLDYLIRMAPEFRSQEEPQAKGEKIIVGG